MEMDGVKKIYVVLHWTTPWSTFGLLLDHLWSTPSESPFDDCSLVFHGVLLDYFWTTFGVRHPSLVFMTVASFLLLGAMLRAVHQQQGAPCRTQLPYNEILYCTVVSDVKCIHFKSL